MKIIKAIVTVSGFTIISRILGLIRDVLLAAVFGVGPVSDAFLIAFKLPNFFRRLFAEGALNAAFVPIFSRLHASAGIDMARQTAEQVFAVLLCSLALFVLCFEIWMPEVMRLVAPGFVNDFLQMKLTIKLARITFPYILFISFAAFYSGILNSAHKFSAAAFSPAILNITIIFALFIIQLQKSSHNSVWVLATSVTTGGLFQFLWLQHHCKKAIGPLNLIRPKLTLNVKKLLKAMAPGALGAGVMQINLFVDTILASMLPSGAVTYLYYADRLNQLPLSIFGIGISTVLLPVLARQFEHGQNDNACDIQKKALELTFALTLPAAIGLTVLAEPILTLLFQHKNFTAHDVSETTKVVGAFLSGLPAYVATKIVTTSFFAQYDTKTPVMIGIASMIINIVLNVCLMGPYQYMGIALGTSITAWLNMLFLGYRLYKRGLLKIDAELLIKLPKIVFAATTMGYSIHLLYTEIFNNLSQTLFMNIVKLLIAIVIGTLAYFIIIIVLRTFNRTKLKLLAKKH